MGRLNVSVINTLKLPNVFQARTQRMLYSKPVSTAFIFNGQYIAVGIDGFICPSGIVIWDVNSGQELRKWVIGECGVSTIDVNPNGDLLAVGLHPFYPRVGDYLKIIGINTGQEQFLKGHDGAIHSVIFSKSGTLLATTGTETNKTIRLWNTRNLENVKTLTVGKSQANVTSTAFSPRVNMLATGDFDNKISLWDVGSGKKLRFFHGHTNRVASLAFSSDGNRLASGSYDHTAKIWNVNTGQLVKSIQIKDGENPWYQLDDGVNKVLFDPKGRFLITRSTKFEKTSLGTYHESEIIRFWEIGTFSLLKSIEVDSLSKTITINQGGDLMARGYYKHLGGEKSEYGVKIMKLRYSKY